MSNDGGRAARDAAGEFGKRMEEAAKNVGKGFQALKNGAPDPQPKPAEKDGNGDVNITINR